MLHEATLLLFKQSPSQFVRAALRIARGRAAFKRAVSAAATPEIRLLPFREEVLEFIAEQRSFGRKIVLATASDSVWARSIADELPIFDDILASDGVHNLKGIAKLQAIQAYCAAQGFAQFDYLGDSPADLPIWKEARGAYIVAPSSRLLKKLRCVTEPAAVLGSRKPVSRTLLRALRPHQWVKNILIFVPLLTSHNVFHFPLVMSAVVAFVCFCLCASAVYVLNDLLDVGADRRHPMKRKRPFASGDCPIPWGLSVSGILLALGFMLSVLTLPAIFSASLVTYFVITCIYSFHAKRIVMLDVLMLAGLYTIRVLAGGAATGIPVSEWLMAFSMFLFVSLAFVKRYTELARLLVANETSATGRGYHVSDIRLIESMGPTSGYIAVLVLALYVNGDQMKALYTNPWPLWLLCPLTMYWISRVWFKAMRGELPDDPIVFALKDRVSLCLGAIAVALVVAGSFL
jgi:4-hydroxybenzoate polyprenyltransferase